jgi:ligand-binding sensor domain-containing protein
LLPSCKERNTEYPPRTWSEYTYTTSDIAPRTISAIYLENEHSIWLGAQGNEGLLHFDGYKWTVFGKDNTGCDFDSVSAMIRDGNGTLWAGWKSGLASFDGTDWHPITAFDGLRVTSLAVEGIGNIKVGIKGKSGGVASLQNNSWTFASPNNSTIHSANINAVASDRGQVLWCATADHGIIRLKNNAWESMTNTIPLLSQEFTCVALAADGSIWAGSSASQLVHFYDDTFTIFNTGTSRPITSVAVADNGNLWCSTSGAGLIKFDGTSWTSYTMDNASLPTNDILNLSKGGPGIIYFSIPGGKVLMIKQ